MDSLKKYEILKIRKGESYKEEDIVAVEYPFTIFLNDKEFATLMCTPNSFMDLTVGFLFSEGIINSKDDLSDIRIDEKLGRAYVYTKNEDLYFFKGDKVCGKRTVTTACGRQRIILYHIIDFLGTDHDKIKFCISLKSEQVSKLMNDFNKKSELFLSTGGVHSCALCCHDRILNFKEDVGRHNALDKILGNALLNDFSLEDKIIATSGRISSEMVMKVVKSKIPVLISRSAPTDSAVEMAKKLNLTLIGFARGVRMNVYTSFDTIKC